MQQAAKVTALSLAFVLTQESAKRISVDVSSGWGHLLQGPAV